VSEEEDDWFERALRDDEADASDDPTDDDEADDPPAGRSPGDGPDGDATDAGDTDAGGSDVTDSGDGDHAGDASDADDDDHAADDTAGDDRPKGMSLAEGDAFGGAAGRGSPGDPTSSGDDGLTFDADFGFGDLDAGDGGEDFGFGDLGGDSPFGGGGEDFGFGEVGGGSPFGGDDLDESAYNTDIDRIQLGIEGLDEMILGGVPRRSLIAVIGSAGTGKTTFGLQFLHQALVEGEKAVYITLEQSREQILTTADDKGWAFSDHAADETLAVVDLDPIQMANSLSSIRNDLPRLIDDFGADRLVLDSVSLLEMMYDDAATRRSEVFDFTRSLKEAGVTTLLTSEASEETPYASRHGIVEYLTDAVFVLQYVRPSNFRETRLAVEIQKIRDANHSRETKPYEITSEGLSVYRQANIF
jgi:KaiC domain protein